MLVSVAKEYSAKAIAAKSLKNIAATRSGLPSAVTPQKYMPILVKAMLLSKSMADFDASSHSGLLYIIVCKADEPIVLETTPTVVVINKPSRPLAGVYRHSPCPNRFNQKA